MFNVSVYALSVVLVTTAFCEEIKPTPTVASPTIAPFATTTPLQTKPIVPAMNFPRPSNSQWGPLLERLRVMPRAGEINNGTLVASLADIFSDSDEAKSKSAAISAEYEKALLEKAVKWEGDVQELRAQYDAKMLAELPEAKRLAAQKLLDMSRTNWSESAAREAKTRAEFLERMRQSSQAMAQAQGFRPGKTNAQGIPVAQPGAEASTWMREEHAKATKQDEEKVKVMRDLLSPEDAARFDAHNRTRPLVAQPISGKTTPMVPKVIPPQLIMPVPAPASSDPIKSNTVEKK